MTEMLKYPYIYYKDAFTEEDQALFAAHCDLAQLKTVRMKDQASIKKYLQHSKATTVAPFKMAQDNIYLQYDVLRPIHIQDVQWHCHIGIVYRKDRVLTREEQFLLEKMRWQLQQA